MKLEFDQDELKRALVDFATGHGRDPIPGVEGPDDVFLEVFVDGSARLVPKAEREPQVPKGRAQPGDSTDRIIEACRERHEKYGNEHDRVVAEELERLRSRARGPAPIPCGELVVGSPTACTRPRGHAGLCRGW